MLDLNQFLIESIPPNAELVIYGAGLLGIELNQCINLYRKDVKVKFFIDKFPKPLPLEVYDFETALNFLNTTDLILIASMPPNSFEMEQTLKSHGFENYLNPYGKIQTNCRDRACHKEVLFIREDGNIYPCCAVWGIERYKIGHVSDQDLLEKIEAFDVDCKCDNFRLIKGDFKAGEKSYTSFNIELSYKCQAKCPMCCVKSPDIGNDYQFDNYDHIERLIKKLKPKYISLQGGEILIQPASLNFVRKIKQKYGTIFSLLTNGNNYNAVEQTEELFDWIIVSFVGFQPETYKCLMGLDIEKTKKFCSKIDKNNKISISLKYLISPNNIHEIPLFMEWALKMKNAYNIHIDDSNSAQYINFNTNDLYWQKVIERTKREIFKILKEYKKEHQIKNKIHMTSNVFNLLKIDESERLALFD